MANWISSKLKVAESILQQIDQQAAESLGKGDGSAPPVGDAPEEIPQKADQSRPLKYQLPKKASPPWHSPGVAAQVSAPPSPSVTRPSAADEDWTEILSSSDPVNSPRGATLGGGSRKAAALPSSVERGARKGSGGFVKPTGKAEVADRGESVADNAPGDGDRPPSRRSSSLLDLTKELFKQEFHGGAGDHSPSRSSDADSKILDVKKSAEAGDGSNNRNIDVRPSSGAHVQSRSSSESAEESSDSASTSDSDEEIRLRREERRRKKEQMLAEKMATVAAEAIRERENIVARLEGEKQSLEKILEEREKKQAQEVAVPFTV